MARTVINPSKFARTGTALTPVAGDVANGNAVPNDGSTGLVVKNTGASSRVLTIAITETVDGQSVPARTVTLAAGATVGVGPFPTETYGARILLNADNAELTILPVRV